MITLPHVYPTCPPYLHNKLLINVFLGYTWLEVLGLQKPEEELVHQLEVWPGGFKGRLVLFWVKFSSRRVGGGGKSTESIYGKLV